MPGLLDRVAKHVQSETALFEEYGQKAARTIDVHGLGSEGSRYSRWRGDRSASSVGYKYFRHWVAVAVGHIARRIASQPILVASLIKTAEARGLEDMRLKAKMPDTLKSHFRVGADEQLRLITDGPLVEVVDRPNSVQSRYEFLYTIGVSLFMTGESYLIGGENKQGQPELWSVPTHWVTALHENGRMFSGYRLNPEGFGEGTYLPPENVARLYFPDPSDPKSALSPVWSQMEAVIVDGQIQNSQKRAFENGIFPGVLLKIGRVGGKDANPRKLMQPHQRRQLMVAAKRIWSGVAKTGEPLIVDGLVDEIEPFTTSPREMDWTDSQEWVRKRIFHAFGINPINTGEIAGVNRAQAAVSEAHQSQNVINPVLAQISVALCPFLVSLFGSSRNTKQKTLVWIDPCKPHDDELEAREWKDNAALGTVTINEIRVQRLGLDPIPGGDLPAKYSDPLFLTAVANIAGMVAEGMLSEQQAATILSDHCPGINEDRALVMVTGAPGPPPAPAPIVAPGLEASYKNGIGNDEFARARIAAHQAKLSERAEREVTKRLAPFFQAQLGYVTDRLKALEGEPPLSGEPKLA